MKLTIQLSDYDSLTVEEATANIKAVLGADAQVSATPINSTPEAYLYFAFQRLITKRQIEAFFDDRGMMYAQKLEELREEVLNQCEELLNKVIIHNESKVS